jgi:hypothetical protein
MAEIEEGNAGVLMVGVSEMETPSFVLEVHEFAATTESRTRRP